MSAIRIFVVLAWVVFAVRHTLLKPARVLVSRDPQSR